VYSFFLFSASSSTAPRPRSAGLASTSSAPLLRPPAASFSSPSLLMLTGTARPPLRPSPTVHCPGTDKLRGLFSRAVLWVLAWTPAFTVHHPYYQYQLHDALATIQASSTLSAQLLDLSQRPDDVVPHHHTAGQLTPVALASVALLCAALTPTQLVETCSIIRVNDTSTPGSPVDICLQKVALKYSKPLLLTWKRDSSHSRAHPSAQRKPSSSCQSPAALNACTCQALSASSHSDCRLSERCLRCSAQAAPVQAPGLEAASCERDIVTPLLTALVPVGAESSQEHSILEWVNSAQQSMWLAKVSLAGKAE
jgi:hypothetical protein